MTVEWPTASLVVYVFRLGQVVNSLEPRVFEGIKSRMEAWQTSCFRTIISSSVENVSEWGEAGDQESLVTSRVLPPWNAVYERR